MKLVSIAVCVVINCTILKAQNFDVAFYTGIKDSEPKLVKYKDAFYSFEIEQKGISGFSANLKRSMHNITLKKFDTAMIEVKRARVPGREKEFGPISPVIKLINDKIYLLYFKTNEKKNVILYAAVVDPTTLVIGESSELLSIDVEERYLEFYMRSVSTRHPNFYVHKNNFASSPSQLYKTFFFEKSPDGNNYLVAWSSAWDNTLFFSVLDNDLNKKRTGNEKLPHDPALALSNAAVDNIGNAYFSYSYSKKNKPFSEILVSKKNGTSEVKSINVPGANPFGAYAAINKVNDKLMICGAYKEIGDYLAGVYILSINTNNLAMSSVSKTPFPKDLVEILDDEGWANKKEKKFGLSDGLVLEANMLDNGMLHLTGEFRSVMTGTKAAFIFAGTILNIRFTGTNAVFSRIPKIRVSAGTTFGDSYRVLTNKNNIVIFYNDHLSNLHRDMSQAPVRSDDYRNSVLAAAIIESDGRVKREVVADKSDEQYLASVGSMQELSPGNYFMAMRRIKTLGGITSDFKWASISTK